jgi:hypothetical protein
MNNIQILFIAIAIGIAFFFLSMVSSLLKIGISFAIPLTILFLVYKNYTQTKDNKEITSQDKDDIQKYNITILTLTSLWTLLLILINYKTLFYKKA